MFRQITYLANKYPIYTLPKVAIVSCKLLESSEETSPWKRGDKELKTNQTYFYLPSHFTIRKCRQNVQARLDLQ